MEEAIIWRDRVITIEAKWKKKWAGQSQAGKTSAFVNGDGEEEGEGGMEAAPSRKLVLASLQAPGQAEVAWDDDAPADFNFFRVFIKSRPLACTSQRRTTWCCVFVV
ncbi:hypothetical protein ABZP36_015849 [Zizania latifolia]